MPKVGNVIADMRKFIRQDQRIIQRLHRRVFLDKVTRDQITIYISFYVEAANRDAFMSVKQELLLAFVECIDRNGAYLARNRLQVWLTCKSDILQYVFCSAKIFSTLHGILTSLQHNQITVGIDADQVFLQDGVSCFYDTRCSCRQGTVSMYAYSLNTFCSSSGCLRLHQTAYLDSKRPRFKESGRRATSRRPHRVLCRKAEKATTGNRARRSRQATPREVLRVRQESGQ